MDPIYKLEIDMGYSHKQFKYIDLERLIDVTGPFHHIRSFQILLHFQLSENPIEVHLSQIPFISQSEENYKQKVSEAESEARMICETRMNKLIEDWKSYKNNRPKLRYLPGREWRA